MSNYYAFGLKHQKYSADAQGIFPKDNESGKAVDDPNINPERVFPFSIND